MINIFLDDTHINAIGSYQPGKREIPSATIARSKIFVDSRETCLKEAGDLIIPKNEGMDFGVTEIGEVLQNEISGNSSGRRNYFFQISWKCCAGFNLRNSYL